MQDILGENGRNLEAMLKQIDKTYSRSNEHCHDENEAVIAYAMASIALSLEKIAAMMEASGGYLFPDPEVEKCQK